MKALIIIIFALAVKVFAQNSMENLATKLDFDRLSGLPLTGKYGHVSAVKVVYELKTKKLFFVNSHYFQYHYNFCKSELNYSGGQYYFNEANYSNSAKRKFLLANVNYFKSLNKYALELFAGDMLDMNSIYELYSAISKASFIQDSLHILVNNPRLHTELTKSGYKIPILNSEDIYQNLEYQAISRYASNGILRFVNNLELEKNKLTNKDIIVLNETPAFLPKVAGIIITEFQTPLSHITILGQNRKIPISVFRTAFQDSSLLSMANQKINYTVTSDSFSIKPIDELEETTEKPETIELKYDLSVDKLMNIEDLGKKSYKYAGNKAANFAILHKLSQDAKFKTPESAFVIPFYFYNEHLKKSDTKYLIDSLLLHKGNFLLGDSLKNYLKRIRDNIVSAPLDSEFVKSVKEKIKSLGIYTQMRFRSSTNAEDAEGFSGAGLYTSKTGDLLDEKKSIEKAIKKVWASMWSFEAYNEREYYNIAHINAYMGILVHRAFPNEDVNGVAITKNLYHEDSFGFVINAQLGDESVVKPTKGNKCDQFICFPNLEENIFYNKNVVDVIALSNLNNNKLIMSEVEIQNLANQLEIIKKYFYDYIDPDKSYYEFGLDIEFKLDAISRDLYIKQVRLFND